MKINIPSSHAPIGNSYGYSRVAEQFRCALRALGSYDDESSDADVEVHITPPYLFLPEPKARNVLFTMFEGESLPAEYRDACELADTVVVPSRDNQRIFAAAGVNTRYCPLGVDPVLFKFTDRKPPRDPQPFRYLWIGAPNPRKGWPILDRAWTHGFARETRMELYVKTTSENEKVECCGNVIADSRNLDDRSLAQLYASAHCFVFPSFGEGFGLTLAEAMATGLPAIFSRCGGVTELFNHNYGYPLTTARVPVEYFGPNFAWAADYLDLIATMRAVFNNYSRALMKGRRAAAYIRNNLTWRHCALTLIRILSTTQPGDFCELNAAALPSAA